MRDLAEGGRYEGKPRWNCACEIINRRDWLIDISAWWQTFFAVGKQDEEEEAKLSLSFVIIFHVNIETVVSLPKLKRLGIVWIVVCPSNRYPFSNL